MFPTRNPPLLRLEVVLTCAVSAGILCKIADGCRAVGCLF